MYVDIVPNRNSRPTALLRESYREGGKVLKRTVANISHLSDEKIIAVKNALSGKNPVTSEEAFTAVERSLPHGHVMAVLGMLKKLGLDRMIGSRRCRERDIIVALIVERIIHPGSKLASTRTWKTSTLAEDLNVVDADVDEIYSALSWLHRRKHRIENKLSSLLLEDGGMALYDLSSSTYYGRKSSLAQYGRSKKGRKKGIPCISYGVLTDSEGRPVSVDVYPSNTGDPTTVLDQAEKLQKRFGLYRVILVGDRGMLADTQVNNLRKYPGIGWITAMRTSHIRSLVDSGDFQMSLFDDKNLAEISSPLYPGERLVACFNPLLQQKRRIKRENLIAATEKVLQKLEKEVACRTRKPLLKDEIALKAGRRINRYNVAKHFELDIEDGSFSWSRREESIKREAALDGVYIIRTSEPEEQISAEDAVRDYKRLTMVERVFRCMKGLDLLIQPIHLSLNDHVRAHIFICMLAYYVEWHLRQDLASLLFEDEELETARKTRYPVKPAKPSESVKRKKITKQSEDGLPLHSFSTLLNDLGTLCRNRCRMLDKSLGITADQLTEATPIQERVFELLDL